MIAALAPLPELVARYPTAETLLDVDADFFAGWGYGMRVGGDLTPASLEPLGVKVYELSESCAQIGERRAAPASTSCTATCATWGRIFDVEPRAERLVASLQHASSAPAPASRRTPRCRGCSSTTAARTALHLWPPGHMPQALIEAAGGRSVTDDVAAS